MTDNWVRDPKAWAFLLDNAEIKRLFSELGADDPYRVHKQVINILDFDFQPDAVVDGTDLAKFHSPQIAELFPTLDEAIDAVQKVLTAEVKRGEVPDKPKDKPAPPVDTVPQPDSQSIRLHKEPFYVSIKAFSTKYPGADVMFSITADTVKDGMKQTDTLLDWMFGGEAPRFVTGRNVARPPAVSVVETTAAVSDAPPSPRKAGKPAGAPEADKGAYTSFEIAYVQEERHKGKRTIAVYPRLRNGKPGEHPGHTLKFDEEFEALGKHMNLDDLADGGEYEPVDTLTLTWRQGKEFGKNEDGTPKYYHDLVSIELAGE